MAFIHATSKTLQPPPAGGFYIQGITMNENIENTRSGMQDTVYRLQAEIAYQLYQEQIQAARARQSRLEQYLANLTQKEVIVGEFYIPRNFDEACAIHDAGGVVYGIC